MPPADVDLERIGHGREADIYALGDRRVLRLAHDPAKVERFALGLEAAQDAGVPVPAIHERVTVEGRPGLVMDRMDRVDLLMQLGKRPWSIRDVAHTLGRLHAAIHEAKAPGDLPPVRELVRERLVDPLVPEEIGREALARLDELPDGDTLCHGDYHPANLLPGPGGHVVIDWTSCGRGPAEADVARTKLLLQFAGIPDHAPLVARRLDRLGRRWLVDGYLGEYGRRRSLDLDEVERWLPVLLAARLGEGVEAERPVVLRALQGSTGSVPGGSRR